MERYRLTDDVWWVGAIDWSVRDFHGYETRRGTTYNSYLITDEKTALVDGVRLGFGDEAVRRIRSCCDPKDIAYLVVNHVEMDHSGAVPELIERLSPVTVLTSKRGEQGLREHYGAEGIDKWDIQTVGTGDEVSLGKHTLQFLEAPMLHWPDSMFTYVEEARTLLPNDAFGQHLATSKRFADEVAMSVVMEEATKYYANILMPFAGRIQKILKKVEELGLEIDVIGPSHGVIWRSPEDIARIVEAYRRWSAFEAEPRVSIIFDTMWRSTERMARAVEDGVAQEGVECRVLRLDRTALAEVIQEVLESRAFLVGSPTLNNGMLPSVGGFLTYLKGLKPRERFCGAFGSYGWAGGAVKQIDEHLRDLGLDVIDPFEIKYVPSEDDLESCVEYGRTAARRVKGEEGRTE